MSKGLATAQLSLAIQIASTQARIDQIVALADAVGSQFSGEIDTATANPTSSLAGHAAQSAFASHGIELLHVPYQGNTGLVLSRWCLKLTVPLLNATDSGGPPNYDTKTIYVPCSPTASGEYSSDLVTIDNSEN